MTDGEYSSRAINLIEQLADQLSESRLCALIDSPLQKAASEFVCDIRSPFSVELFHQILADFVRHLYRTGFPIPQELSDDQAHAEALYLVEHFYAESRELAYDLAILDARHVPDCGGILFVLSTLLQSFRNHLRQMYTRSVYLSLCDPLDWKLKIELCRVLIQRLGRDLPPFYLQHPLEEMAHHWQKFFEDYLASR